MQSSRTDTRTIDTVLVVNHSPDQLATLGQLLRESGYRVVTAVDGADGVEVARRARPDLIVSDVAMPRMDGVAMCQAVRQIRELATTPILLVSGILTDAASAAAGLRAGADDYMEIPFEPLRLVSKAARLIERKRAEEVLRASQAELMDAQRIARVGSWSWRPDTDTVTWSDEMFRIAGRDPGDGAPPIREQGSMYSPAGWNDLQRAMAHSVATGTPCEVEVQLVRPDGERRWVIARAAAVVDENGRTVRLHGTAQDVTERRLAHVLLQESEQRFRLMTETIRDVFWMRSPGMGGAVAYVSPGYETVWQRSIESVFASPRSFLDAIHPDDRARVEQVLSVHRDAPFECEYRIVRPSGEVRWIRDRGYPVRSDSGTVALMTGVASDITELQQQRDALQAAQRLEAVGRLAGGVAHDFNNLLVAILGYAELALRGMRAGDPMRDDLEEILKAGNRAAALTRQLLAFSRKQVLNPEIISLNDIISGMEPMLRRLIREDLDLQVILDPALGVVLADPTQIEQVVMNLVVNARDAIAGSGTIRLQTANAAVPGAAHATAGSVLLSVTDTGTGMDDQVKANLFDPFFTTKPNGQGTGLGLATVYGIVKQSGGSIEVDSGVGRGTTFRITLPAVQPDRKPSVGAVPARPHGGTETVLVVEDEAVVCALMQRVLTGAGYRVITAANGQEALDAAVAHDGPIDLLLTDVVMPQMGGPDLAARLVQLQPTLRVLFVSGYSARSDPADGIPMGSVHLVQKPFTADSLVRAVRDRLDAPHSGS